jgi:uncharacterized protein
MIHLFKQNGYGICLDVNSGAIHVLDDHAFEILSNCKDYEDYKSTRYEKYDNADNNTRLVYDEIDALIDEGSLFSEIDLPDRSDSLVNVELKALCLHMAHTCNLKCSYCFAGDGEYSGGTKLMPLGVAEKAVDLLLSKSGKKKNVEIDFFGGEPMLNFDVVKKTVEYARKEQKKYNKEVHFTITTNGTILDDDSLQFINENMDNVVLSIDGRKEVHDRLRVYADGSGSYDKVLPNIKKIADGRNGKSYFVRGTYTAANLDFHNDIEHLAGLGFTDISIEPVTGGDYELNDEQVRIAEKEYEFFSKRYAAQRDYTFYHFNLELYNSPCIFKRLNACGAGFEYGAITPDGEIFACHRLAGIPEFKMGDVHEGIFDLNLASRMKTNNVTVIDDCTQCWAKYFCSGGCPATAYFANGRIDKPDNNACRLQRKRIECAMAVEVERAMEE